MVQFYEKNCKIELRNVDLRRSKTPDNREAFEDSWILALKKG